MGAREWLREESLSGLWELQGLLAWHSLSQALVLSTPTPGLWLETAWALQLREPPHLDPEQVVSLLSRLPGIFRPHWALGTIGETESLEGGRRDSRQCYGTAGAVSSASLPTPNRAG